MNRYGKWLVLGLLIMPFAAAGETYKCRGPNGKISYSGQMSLERGVKCEPMFVKKPTISMEAQPAPDAMPDMPAGASQPGMPQPGMAAAQPSAVPPPGQPALPGEASKPVAPVKTPADIELDAKRKKQEAEEAKKKADKANQAKLSEQKLKDDNCKAAQANMQLYQVGGRISRMDDKGEKVYLGDEEIKQRLEQARQEVSRWCS